MATSMPKNDAAPGSHEAATDGSDPAAAVLCPRCGYDVRSATSGRCSECGLILDRSAAAASNIPWAHRRQIGRTRALVKTVWLVTVDAGAIRHELARPQLPRDADRFRWWNAACLAAALGIWAAVYLTRHGIDSIAVQRTSSGGTPLSGFQQDLFVPWSAGTTLLPVIPLCLLGLAAYLTGMGRSIVRLRGYPPQHRQRATALAVYALGPLAWLLPASILYSAEYGVRRLGPALPGEFPFVMAATLFAWTAGIALAIGLGASLHRFGEWHTRAHHAAAGRYAAGVAEILGRSLLGIVVFLGIVPWCMGLIWVIADSFRP
jgi:hypothetical protein